MPTISDGARRKLREFARFGTPLSRTTPTPATTSRIRDQVHVHVHVKVHDHDQVNDHESGELPYIDDFEDRL